MVQGECVELRKSREFKVFYTGGDYALNSTGDILFTTCTNLVKVLSVSDGSERYSIGDPEQESRVTSFVLSDDDSEIIIAYSNDVIKRYSLTNDSCTLLRQFRGTHNAPIMVMKRLRRDSLADTVILATGSSDYSVKIWDLKTQCCTHNFRGKFVVSTMCFAEGGDRLIVGYAEGLVKMFSLKSHPQDKKVFVEWSHHSGRITAILPGPSAHTVIVFSHDQTMSLLNVKTLEVLKVTSLSSTVEAATTSTDNKLLVVGEQGLLKICSLDTGGVSTETKICRSALEGVIFCKLGNIAACSSVECDIILVELKTLRIVRQFAGYNDEIFDVCFISPRSNCLAVASNTADMRIYNLSSYSCHLIHGHSQSILSVDSPGWNDFLLATGSKDNTIMLWQLSSSIASNEPLEYKLEEQLVRNVAIGTGHTNSVTSVKFSHLKSHPFIVTVSNDATLKIWPIPTIKDDNLEIEKLVAACTFVAHSKDINSVDVSLNDKLCVTASMDKTAKLWHIDKKTMQFGIAGTLEGHKRGVWSAKFSRNLQNVATCSGDCTIKIFSLLDKSCLQTLSGHSFAVLSVLFINKGSKLLSADGGGLMKIWDLEKGVCEKTIEAHSDKIWALKPIESDITNDNEQRMRYITVGADGQVIVWDDFSKEAHEEILRGRAKKLADLQTLSNFMEQEKYADALALTLDLAQPYQCLNVVKKIIAHDNGKELCSIFKKLDPIQMSILLDFASQWNTNTKTSTVSQTLLNHALRNIPPEKLLNLPNMDSLIKAFIPYTNRHYERLTNMKTNVSHLHYVFSRMRLD